MEHDLELQYKFRSMVFSDFAAFSNLLNKYFDGQNENALKDDHLEVVKMLKHIHFHPKEWEARAVKCSHGKHYTRSLVAFGHNYSLHLICWKPHQKNVIHNHNHSFSFFKLLAGSLSEKIFFPPEEGKPMKVKQQRKLTPLEVVQHAPSDVHQISNEDPNQISYSLHVYSPPLKQCHAFSPENGAMQLYDCNHHLTKAKHNPF